MLTASAMVLSAGVPAVQATEINNSGINDYGYETYELWADKVTRAIDNIPPVDQLTLDDADQADQWITSLPTVVTKDNIRQVEKELVSLKEFMNGMSEEARSYMWKTKELQTLQVIVADCRIELSTKREEFTASCPTDLKTKVLNYKTIQIS